MHVQESARQTRSAPTVCRPAQLAPRSWFLLVVQHIALIPVRSTPTLRMQLAFLVTEARASVVFFWHVTCTRRGFGFRSQYASAKPRP